MYRSRDILDEGGRRLCDHSRGCEVPDAMVVPDDIAGLRDQG